MCLVLKLDNGKGVSIANEQIADEKTEPPSIVLVYRYVCKLTNKIIIIFTKIQKNLKKKNMKIDEERGGGATVDFKCCVPFLPTNSAY